MRAISKAADHVLSWMLRSENAQAQEGVNTIYCECWSTSYAYQNCGSHMGEYCGVGPTHPLTFSRCC